MIAIAEPTTSPSAETLHHQFIDHIIPAVELHAGVQFRYLKGQDRNDAVQETMAVAWQLFVQATDAGKAPASFPTYIAAFAVKRVKSGRLLAGSSSRDVLSSATQQRHGFEVHSLDDNSCDPDSGWKAAVAMDSKNFTPADTVAFRVDFGRWLNGLSSRDRGVGERLAVGDRPGLVASKLGLAPATVSRLRRKLQRSWESFQEAVPVGVRTAGVPA